MSSSLRRGTLAATTLALAAVTLTACGAGNSAQTLEVKPDTAAMHQGTIKLQNVNIVTDTKDSGAATVTGRIFNDGKKDQTLKSISVDGSGERARLSPAKDAKGESSGKDVVVPAGGSLALGGKDHAEALFTDAEAAGVRDGNAQGLTFDLSTTGTIKIRATVVSGKGEYKEYGPTVQPSESPRGGASGSPSDAPSTGGKPSTSEKPGDEQQGQNAEDRQERGGDARTTPDAGDEQDAHAGH